MKNKKLVFFILLIFLIIISSCKKSEKKTFKIKGPEQIISLIKPIISKFLIKHPNINLILESIEDARAISSYLDGTCDFAISTRKFNSDELNSASSLNKRVQPYAFISDAVRVIVSEKNRLKNISLDLIKRILSQKVTDWSDIFKERIQELIKQNQRDRAQRLEKIIELYASNIEICVLNNLYAMHVYLLDIINARYFSSQIKFFKNEKTLMQYVSTHNNAIGFVSSVTHLIRCTELTVDGIKISNDTIINNTYPLIRKYYLFVPRNNRGIEIIDFVLFLKSPFVQSYLKERGFSRP